MPLIKVNEIKANVDRQREDLGDIEDLANSIKEFGLLEPILLDDDHNLVAGMRRLTACLALGMDEVKAEFLGKIDPYRARQIELEENIRRKDLEWQEEAKAVAELHQMKVESDPMWNVDKTAATIGMSRRTVYNAIELDKAIGTVPDIDKADTAFGAMLRLRQHKQIETRKEDAKVRVLRENLGLSQKVSVEVVCADALKHLASAPDDSVDFVVTNPPFGVEIESVFKGERTIYEDSEDSIVDLIGKTAQQVFRVLKNDRWFVMFYPTERLHEGAELLARAGFTFQRVPCIWYKPNKFVSALSQPYQSFSIQYETFFWARKGSPKFHKLRLGNVFVYDTPGKDRLHPLQMPVDLWEEILEIGSVTGELVVEPFAGSGSCGIAAINKERNYLGIELSEEYTQRANTWISEILEGKPSKPTPTSMDEAEPGSPLARLKDLEL